MELRLGPSAVPLTPPPPLRPEATHGLPCSRETLCGPGSQGLAGKVFRAQWPALWHCWGPLGPVARPALVTQSLRGFLPTTYHVPDPDWWQ